jgi:hypothetical protein
VVYRIDADDRLVYADGAFHRFALASGVPDLPERWLGQSIWRCIGDDEMRAIFTALVGRARAGHRLTVNTRCDTPSVGRTIVMEIVPAGDGAVEFRCELDQARILAAPQPSSRELLLVCAWCYRAERDGWRDIEEVVASERLLERSTVPMISHGICDGCLSETSAALEELTVA